MLDQCGTTTTHVYNKTEKLGVGASCDVYKGVQKNTGRTHALKIFKSDVWSSSFEHYREVEALKKLKHPNIVAFYGREKEMSTGRTVLVMEYCQGGSLYSFLQEPENMHGLGDKEFLIFLTDTCAGLKHLRISGFVHRDIKPGNILRCQLFDGTVNYKISDFGSSKDVKNDNGEFMSLAGTEEYLHPDMYVKAFVRKDISSSFNNTVDLWSLGCTIFHACTNEIPFKPRGGVRHNRNIMYIMITCKPNGAISGSQIHEDTDVQWQYKLPESCQIAKSLRIHVEKTLAGLVEGEKSRQWTFETFEKEVQKITSLKKVCVVNMDYVSMHTIYSSSQSSFTEFRKNVAVSIQIPSVSSQYLLFHKNKQLSELTDFSLETIVNEDIPVFLIHKGGRKQILPHQTDPFPSFTAHMSLEEDVKIALKQTWAVLQCCIQIKTSELVHQGLIEANLAISSELMDRFLKIERNYRYLLNTSQDKRSLLEMIGEWEVYRTNISQATDVTVSNKYTAAKKFCLKIHQMLYTVQDRICLIQSQKWFAEENSTTNIDKSDEKQLSSGAHHLFEESKSTWRRMKSRAEHKPISEFEQEIHKKDKKDLHEICAYSVHLLHDFCQPKTQMLYDRLNQHKRTYLERCATLTNIEEQLNTVKKNLDELTNQLYQIRAFSGKAWTQLSKEISMSTRFPSDCSMILIKEHNEIKEKLTALQNELLEVEIVDVDRHTS